MAINYGHDRLVTVSIADAKDRLPELVRAVEAGEKVVITRHGRPVAQLTPAPIARGRVRLGAMKDRIRLNRGWAGPIDDERFMTGDL